MPRTIIIVVAGLDGALWEKSPDLRARAQHMGLTSRALKPILPAVTATMQATLTTGRLPTEHGIIANGLFTHHRTELHNLLDLSSFAESRKQVSFWEQSNELLDAPRFWKGAGKTVAMLFFQHSMDGAADIVLTPKPEHGPDGKTLSACYSSPKRLYTELTAELGPFPLQHYWGPMAGFNSSDWIIKSAMYTWRHFPTDLQFVYIPYLDYDLQRLGPSASAIPEQAAKIADALDPLVKLARLDNAQVIICGDYGMFDVDTAVAPNLALRRAGLLATKTDDKGKLLIDFDAMTAMAMVDHQIAHIYCGTGCDDAAANLFSAMPGVDKVLTLPKEFAAHGLDHGRSGDIVLLAKPNAWFMHDWWENDDEKPAWQFTVDIHRKPGYDPRELFFDRERRVIAQDARLVKGSHGLVGDDRRRWPIFLCDESIAPDADVLDAKLVAPFIRNHW